MLKKMSEVDVRRICFRDLKALQVEDIQAKLRIENDWQSRGKPSLFRLPQSMAYATLRRRSRTTRLKFHDDGPRAVYT